MKEVPKVKFCKLRKGLVIKMKKFQKLRKYYSMLPDIINRFLGIVIIILIVLLVRNPNNSWVILGAFLVGGLMNILNGVKQLKMNSNKQTNYSLIMLGIILVFLGILFFTNNVF